MIDMSHQSKFVVLGVGSGGSRIVEVFAQQRPRLSCWVIDDPDPLQRSLIHQQIPVTASQEDAMRDFPLPKSAASLLKQALTGAAACW